VPALDLHVHSLLQKLEISNPHRLSFVLDMSLQIWHQGFLAFLRKLLTVAVCVLAVTHVLEVELLLFLLVQFGREFLQVTLVAGRVSVPVVEAEPAELVSAALGLHTTSHVVAALVLLNVFLALGTLLGVRVELGLSCPVEFLLLDPLAGHSAATGLVVL